MAFITAEIKIPDVGQSILCRLYFPTDLPETVGNEVRGVITLLHGVGNSASDWMHMSAACRYAADNGYVLVAPSAQNGFYLNMAYGPPWHTVLAELLPAQLNKIFRLPAGREQNYIAGLSMGGYGALRIALLNPGRFAAAGSFSGALDIRGMAASAGGDPQLAPFFAPLFGGGFAVPEDADLFQLAKRAAALPEARRPRVFMTCGAHDNDVPGVYAQNRRFWAAADALGLGWTHRVWAGVHEWNFWDRSLAEFIGFIQHSDYAGRKRADWAAETENER